MWDYWFDDSPGECDSECGPKCISPIHRTYAAYMAPQPVPEPLNVLDATLVRMFDLRIALDFVLSDTINLTWSSSDRGHYLIRSRLQYMALDFHTFGDMADGLVEQLDEARRNSISHLLPVLHRAHELASGMPDMRRKAVRPGIGLFGDVNRPNGNEYVPPFADEESFLVCANLALTFIDGLLYAIPDTFCSALSKIPPNGSTVSPCDHDSISKESSSYMEKNPIHCVDFDRMGKDAPRVATELIRVRWALRSALDRHKLACIDIALPNRMSRLWNTLLRPKLVLCAKQVIIELHTLLALYDTMRSAGCTPSLDDAIVGNLLEHRDAITRLRNTAVSRDDAADYEPFFDLIEREIGHERLILLASVAHEWILANSNHYQERCAGYALVPDLPDMTRRIDFLEAARKASFYRVKAKNALDRVKIPAMAH